MTRFFVEPRELDCETVMLTGENAAHARVLRLKAGEQLLVCDGQGREALCSVAAVGNAEVELSVEEIRASSTEPAIRASVYMALPKSDKLEHVIQKATELGAYEIVTFPTERCVSRPDEKSLKKKAGALAKDCRFRGGAVRPGNYPPGDRSGKLSGGTQTGSTGRQGHRLL